MEWYLILALIAVGAVAGFINTLAGSGSLITLPVLMFLGLPANVANGTNRVGILLQNMVGAGSFHQQKMLNLKQATWLTIPAVLGSIVGALIAVDLNEEILEKFIGGLLIFMFFIILYKPEKWLKNVAGEVPAKPKFWQQVIFFFIGMYGGFIQAGVGFFLLAGLVLGSGYDLVRGNALKLFINLIFTISAIIVFILNDQVNWMYGIILASGNMAGAFVASRIAVSWGPKFIRYILLATVLLAAFQLLFHIF